MCSPTKLARGNCLKGKNKGFTILLHTGSCCMYLKQESSVVLVVAINTYLQGHKWIHEFNFLVISERFVCVVWLCNVFCARLCECLFGLVLAGQLWHARLLGRYIVLLCGHRVVIFTCTEFFCTRKVVAYKYIIFKGPWKILLNWCVAG